MKILVIGGNRFVGKRLVDLLVDQHDVTILNRSGTGHDKAIKIKTDRDQWDGNDIEQFDYIVDMCLFDVNQFNKIKTRISEHTKYIFISSGAVEYIHAFGKYAEKKKIIESEIENSNLNYTIIRPSYIDGIDNHRPRIEYYIKLLSSYQEVDIKGNHSDYPINIVDVDDVALCIKRVIETKSSKPSKKIYNACGDQSTTIDQIINIIKQKLDIQSHTMYNNSTDAPFINHPLEMDNRLIKRELGVHFKNIEVIIDSIIRNPIIR